MRLVANTPDLQTYTVQKLYAALKEDITQEGLTLAGSWAIGEYADTLLRGGQYEEEELVKEVKENDIVDLFGTILNSNYAGQVVTEYIITAAMKLTTRLSDSTQVERLRRLMMTHQTHLDVEIQQRAVEYGNLFAYDSIRKGVLERMPPPEIREAQRVLGESTSKKRSSKLVSKKKPSQVTEQDMLLDLMGGSDVPGPAAPSNTNGSQNNADLLADILGGGGMSSPPPQTTSPPAGQSNVNSIMDLFSNNSGTNTPQPQPAAAARPPPSADLFGGLASPPPAAATPPPGSAPAHEAYNKNDLHITFQVQRSGNSAQILARFRNASNFGRLSNVTLQAAVPKSQKLALQAISNSDLDGGMEATQQMRIGAVSGVS